MSKITAAVTMSIDGFVAGPNQRLESPFGDIDENILHRWMFDDQDQPEHKDQMREYLVDAGAFIMGSNMFVPSEKRNDPEWKGWWGDNPPYHAPVFVLAHRPHEPIPMNGGTTFTFVTDGVEAALEQAKQVAGDRKIHIAGGANTINQYLALGVIDELWLHIAPTTIGKGARLFDGVHNLKLEPIEVTTTELASHILYKVLK